LLEGFTPHATMDLFGKSYDGKYYKAILQNLFFAMLNSPITTEGSTELTERHFRSGRGDYDNNKLMRYEDYFINPQLFVDLANKTVPFLNGGLFDCLDDKDNGIYLDGFSDRETVRNKLAVPDFLFFGEEVGKDIDLSDWYGDKNKKKVSARGIIDILKRYNFTVEENTPFDKEVSLDPELLGKVFENLLASFNPETQTTARKQTGSFYTPREIVQYMVDESIVAHLKRTVGEELEPKFRQLLQYTDDLVDFTDEQRKQIMQSLYECKILDPACGSGAFPMGILQQLVHILGRIDSDNNQWRHMMINQAIDETTEAFKNGSGEEQKELIADVERSFDEGVNRPDYARKLYLIENCIYGVDIQPIAIQISKLRFFISLVVDQNTNTDPTDNFGIRPLPNLEAKFVAANTLIGLNKKDTSLFDTEAIKAKENELKVAKHKIFRAKTVRTKRKYRQIVNDLRQEIADMLKDCGAVGNAEAQQLASWDMFNQNASSPFFDPEWMFGIKDGFDIVIGNPPYGVSIKGDYRKNVVASLGNVPDYEIYYYFIQIAEQLIIEDGILSYIIPNTYLFNTFAQKYRACILNVWNVIEILDCTKFPIFDKAVVRNTINTWQKKTAGSNIIGYRNTTNIKSFDDLIAKQREFLSKEGLLA
ncbi:MAG: Eco57I restriction-modification methylase domain-containing protein, partial [Cloacibacterium sp.]